VDCFPLWELRQQLGAVCEAKRVESRHSDHEETYNY